MSRAPVDWVSQCWIHSTQYPRAQRRAPGVVVVREAARRLERLCRASVQPSSQNTGDTTHQATSVMPTTASTGLAALATSASRASSCSVGLRRRPVATTRIRLARPQTPATIHATCWRVTGVTPCTSVVIAIEGCVAARKSSPENTPLTTGISPSSNDSCKPSGPPVTARRSSAIEEAVRAAPRGVLFVLERQVRDETRTHAYDQPVAVLPDCKRAGVLGRAGGRQNCDRPLGAGERRLRRARHARGDRLRGPTREEERGEPDPFRRGRRDVRRRPGVRRSVLLRRSQGADEGCYERNECEELRGAESTSDALPAAVRCGHAVGLKRCSRARDRATVSALGREIERSSRGV